LYDGANLIEETDSGGSEMARYVFGSGIDEPLAASRGASTKFYQADGLGSITSLSTTAGVVGDSFVYDSYGNVTSSTGSFAQPFRFTGREWDVETGLYYYRARYYEPTTGQFLSEDPNKMGVGLSLYSYVGNSPISYDDPLGLARRKPKPNDPLLGVVEEKYVDEIAIGYHAALARVKSGDCAKFFCQLGEATLRATTFHTYVDVSSTGAYTDNTTWRDVYLNEKGGYFNASEGLIRLPASNTIYMLGTAADVQAFIILHELAHELNANTGFVSDAASKLANENNSLMLLKKCFADARIRRK